MYSEEEVIVEEIIYEDECVQIIHTTGRVKKAIVYLQFHSSVKVNDVVIVNNTATKLKLGTGGVNIVAAIKPAVALNLKETRGHIMKARYLPCQHSVLSVEEQSSEYHELFQQPFQLNEKKILLGELHSMIPVCYWAAHYFKENLKFVVIIDDHASLPLSFSNQMRALSKQRNFITITIGQAFGGTYEAVNIATALQFATVILQADVILVSFGPGVVGTNTRYGFSGMEQANWANLIGSLNGIPVWVPRLSLADNRERHRGISHHTLTPLTSFTYAKSVLPLPNVTEEVTNLLKAQTLNLNDKHQLQWVSGPFEPIISHCLKKSSLEIKTMGRGFEEDPYFFYGVIAAIKLLLQ